MGALNVHESQGPNDKINQSIPIQFHVGNLLKYLGSFVSRLSIVNDQQIDVSFSWTYLFNNTFFACSNVFKNFLNKYTQPQN